MQTTKFLFVIGVAAILAAPLQVTAGPDSEAQAKMREAMRQKMEELNAQSAPAPASPPPVVVEPARPKPAPAPAVKAPTVVVPVPAEPVVVQTPAAPAKATGANSRFSTVPDAAADAQAARMQEALRQKIAAENAGTPSAPARPAAVVRAPGTGPAAVVVRPVVTPIETAPSPLSGSKQQRLVTLLQQYKSDQITPQQYHTQRAAIIAEP